MTTYLQKIYGYIIRFANLSSPFSDGFSMGFGRSKLVMAVEETKTLAEVLATLADNTSKEISPRDMRILILSLAVKQAQISLVGGSTATLITNINSFVEANVPDAVISAISSVLGSDDFEMVVPGQLRYLGVETRAVRVTCTVSFISLGNNQEIYMQLGKNGTPSDEAQIQRKVGGDDVGSTALAWSTTLGTGDYVSLFIKNITAENDITIVAYNLWAGGTIM